MLVTWAGLAGGASAVEVSGDRGDPEGGSVGGGDVVVADFRDDSNRLAITVRDTRTTVVERNRASLKASGSCRRRSPHVAVCRTYSIDSLTVAARGGPDVVRLRAGCHLCTLKLDGGPDRDRLMVSGASAELRGGPGRDVLRGGRRRDRLFGGAGNDRLFGGPGKDTLIGEGPSAERAGGRGSDRLDGGGGRDSASWAERSSSVRADLARRFGGARGERDRLVSIEGLIGGKGPDRLAGDSRANTLAGLDGADRLTGRGGGDMLNPGNLEYDDTHLRPRDRTRDRVRCGGGRDRVDAPGLDPLPRSCERFSAYAFGGSSGDTSAIQPRRLSGNRLQFQLVCDRSVVSCTRRVVLRAHGVELGSSRTVKNWRYRQWLTVRLRRPLPHGVIEVRHEGSNEEEDPIEPEGVTEEFDYLFRYRLLR